VLIFTAPEILDSIKFNYDQPTPATSYKVSSDQPPWSILAITKLVTGFYEPVNPVDIFIVHSQRLVSK
jgi:hypothetical protein